MLDRLRIEERFAEIRKRLRQLKETAETVEEVKFLTDHLVADASERRLQIAIQACLDIAVHIVAQMALEKPHRENKELFFILAKEKIIDSNLVQRLVAMAGMRNILVYDYTEVKREKIYNVIKNNLADIEAKPGTVCHW